MPDLVLQRTGDTLELPLGEYHSAVSWADIALHETTGQCIYDDAAKYGRDLFGKTFRQDDVRTLLATLPTKDNFTFTGSLELIAIPVSPVDDPHVLNTEREWKNLVEAVTVTNPLKSLTKKYLADDLLGQKTFPSIIFYEDGLQTQHGKCGRSTTQYTAVRKNMI